MPTKQSQYPEQHQAQNPNGDLTLSNAPGGMSPVCLPPIQPTEELILTCQPESVSQTCLNPSAPLVASLPPCFSPCFDTATKPCSHASAIDSGSVLAAPLDHPKAVPPAAMSSPSIACDVAIAAKVCFGSFVDDDAAESSSRLADILDSSTWEQCEHKGVQCAVLGSPLRYTWDMMEKDMQTHTPMIHGLFGMPFECGSSHQAPFSGSQYTWDMMEKDMQKHTPMIHGISGMPFKCGSSHQAPFASSSESESSLVPVWSVADLSRDVSSKLKSAAELPKFVPTTSTTGSLKRVKSLPSLPSSDADMGSSPRSQKYDCGKLAVHKSRCVLGYGTLHDEMSAYSAHVSATQYAQRSDVIAMWQYISEVVMRLWPRARIHLYGSRACGLSLADSDIDFVITDASLEMENGASNTSLLAAALEQEPWVNRVFALDRAMVPVIKLQSRLSTCSTDITFVSSQICASMPPGNSCLAMRGMLCQLTSHFPTMPPLVFVLKQYLRENGLNESYSGGLSSVCLSCMVAVYLMQHQHAVDDDLGVLMIGFLEHYAQLDYMTNGISLQSGYFRRPQDGCALFVEDPLQPGSAQNIAKSTFAMEKVKASFWHARCVLQGTKCGGHSCACSTRDGSRAKPVFGSTRLSRLLASRECELANVLSPLEGLVYQRWQP